MVKSISPFNFNPSTLNYSLSTLNFNPSTLNYSLLTLNLTQSAFAILRPLREKNKFLQKKSVPLLNKTKTHCVDIAESSETNALFD